MQSFSMQGHKRVHHVNFLQPHQRGWKHFSLPEYSENSGKCISITLSTHVETIALLQRKSYTKVLSFKENVAMKHFDPKKIGSEISNETEITVTVAIQND